MTGFELQTSGMEATAIPTEPQPLPKGVLLFHERVSLCLQVSLC